jgi:hypothetical protein
MVTAGLQVVQVREALLQDGAGMPGAVEALNFTLLSTAEVATLWRTPKPTSHGLEVLGKRSSLRPTKTGSRSVLKRSHRPKRPRARLSPPSSFWLVPQATGRTCTMLQNTIVRNAKQLE